MFWSLLLSHLIADYPLQTDAMVQAKKTILGLTAHVAIHFITMIVILVAILGEEWRLVWPYILGVAIAHYAIDTWKNMLSKLWPQWVISGYAQDQALHLLSIGLVTLWAISANQELIKGGAPNWVIYGVGCILVSHVAFVTERVFSYQHKPYQQWVGDQMWPRMMSRLVLFSAFLMGFNAWGVLAVVGSLLLSWFDLAGSYRWRAIVIDVGIVIVVITIMLGAMIGWPF